MLPASVPCDLGWPSATLAVAADRAATLGLSLVELWKTDDAAAHTPLPFLTVNVLRKKETLIFASTHFLIPRGGFSQCIDFNMTGIEPYQSVKLDAVVLQDDAAT